MPSKLCPLVTPATAGLFSRAMGAADFAPRLFAEVAPKAFAGDGTSPFTPCSTGSPSGRSGGPAEAFMLRPTFCKGFALAIDALAGGPEPLALLTVPLAFAGEVLATLALARPDFPMTVTLAGGCSAAAPSSGAVLFCAAPLCAGDGLLTTPALAALALAMVLELLFRSSACSWLNDRPALLPGGASWAALAIQNCWTAPPPCGNNKRLRLPTAFAP
mmetsp:Transcript_11762/g.21410  ORF Transcript_11762/g.21410 Transcript_11762/m.21410 type:complete len:217 (-) Transcript_11762:21-671(-)